MSEKDLTVEELIDAAKKEGETEQLSDAELFIKEMGIEASDTERVPTYVIYWFYLKWKKARGETNIVERRKFFRGWKYKFKPLHTQRRYTRTYKIKSEKFKITREEYRQILIQLREEREWYAQRRKKEIKRKTSV